MHLDLVGALEKGCVGSGWDACNMTTCAKRSFQVLTKAFWEDVETLKRNRHMF